MCSKILLGVAVALGLLLLSPEPGASASPANGPAVAKGGDVASGGSRGRVLVTSGRDHGPGSLRQALEAGATRIAIARFVSIVSVESTLEYAGRAPLTLRGTGQVIDGGGGGFVLFSIPNGADVTVADMTFTDGGGYSSGQGGGDGILLNVPVDRTGIVRLSLTDVTVSGVGGHGIHVRDCARPDCGKGGGSPASVDIRLQGVRIDTSGAGRFDADGVRIDERGEGGIAFRARRSKFIGNGADGVELDERGRGDITLDLRDNVFDGNGGYCSAVDPREPADPSCIEDGELDLDDGIDVDEAGVGSVRGHISGTWIVRNLDEGLDVDEKGPGDLDLELVDVRAENNRDEGMKLSENDAGHVEVRLRKCGAIGNGDDGIRIDESGAGDLSVLVHAATIQGNGEDGLQVEESGKGDGTLRIRGSRIEGGVQSDARRL